MKKNYFRNYLSFTLVLLLALGVINVPAGQTAAPNSESFPGALNAPVIAVEKTSYKSGETIVITGKGFNRFEHVSLAFESVSESLNQNFTLAQWDVYADGRGRIFTTYEFNHSLSLMGSKFVIRAFGNKTGLEAQAAVGGSAPPVVFSSNIDCADLNASTNAAFAGVTSDFGFKIDSPVSQGTFTLTNNASPPRVLTGGAPSDSSNSVTVTFTQFKDGEPVMFDWSSTLGIDAVIVKAQSTNAYPYDPEAISDTGLSTPQVKGISHIEFCYDYEPATSASAMVSGRVVDANGRSIRNVVITVTDLETGAVSYARTTTFGYYNIELPVGESFLLSVSARGYRFEPATKLVTVNESLANVDFVGHSGGKKSRERF